MKKKLIYALMICCLITSSCLIVNAQDGYIKTDTIPEEMLPYSEIEFVNNDEYVIKKGGNVKKYSKIYSEPITIKTLKNIDISSVYYGSLPKPVKGLKVYYASDGFILNLEYPNGMQNPMLEPLKDESYTIKPFGGPSQNDKLLYTWGAHKNQVYQIGNTKGRLGVGRATTFYDKKGQRDNILKKGDVATSLKYDNCPYNTKLQVRTTKKNGQIYQRPMYKRDVGGMPDAVLDIWKTGVEYWGYSWSKNFSMPKTVQYTHSGVAEK